MIETADSITYLKGGLYDTVSSYGTGTVCADGADIRNATYDTLEIAAEVGDGSVSLSDVTVKTALAVNGGGTHSLTLTDCRITVMIVNDADCHVVLGEGSQVGELVARTTNQVDVYGDVNVLELLPAGEESGEESSGLSLYNTAVVGRLSTSGLAKVNKYGADIKDETVLSKEEMSAIRSAAKQLTGASMENRIAVETENGKTEEAAPGPTTEEGITTVEEQENPENTEGDGGTASEQPAGGGNVNPKPDMSWLEYGEQEEVNLPKPSTDVPTIAKPGETAPDQGANGEQPAIDVTDTPIITNGITAIGDSVMLGAKPSIESKFSNIYIDAKESRQVWDGKSIVESADAQGKLYSTVVIGLGTNSTFAVSKGQEIVDACAGRKIYWVNTCGEKWQDQVNPVISQVCANNSNVTLVDWAAEAAGHSDWFFGDGIHLTQAGRDAYAELLYRTINQ